MSDSAFDLEILALSKRITALEQSREPTREAAEHNRTCEVRWDERSCGWRIHWPGAISAACGSIGYAVALANENGSRVTNDPREVVLRQRGDRWFLDSEVPGGVAWMSCEAARHEAQHQGWRILREESAEAKDCVVVSDYGMNNNRMTLADARAYADRLEAPGTRVMRLVPVEGEK